MTLPPRVAPPTQAAVPEWCLRDHLAASHLVAHDALHRGPRERARMLRRIGLRRIVWDWRDEHVDAFDAELDALRAEGVDLAGIWTPLPMPAYEEPDYAHRFGLVPARLKSLIIEAARRGHSPDLWTQISFGAPGTPAPISEAAHAVEVQRAADHLTGLVRLARGHGMCVVLTNHGGWAGEPRTLVDVVTELARRGLGNVGIGFRLQHAHHLIADLDQHLRFMGEHLVAVMLSGADAGAELSGRVILPFGAGSRDRWVTHALLESGWQGQLLVHAVGRDDSEARLLDSLEGWEWSVDRFLRHPRPRPTPRIVEPTWPPGPDWAGRGPTVGTPRPAPSPAPAAAPAAPWPLAASFVAPPPVDADALPVPPATQAAREFAALARERAATASVPIPVGSALPLRAPADDLPSDAATGGIDRARVPVPYGQAAPQGAVTPDAAAVFFAAAERAAGVPTVHAQAAGAVAVAAPASAPLAPPTAPVPTPGPAPATTGTIPRPSPLGRMGVPDASSPWTPRLGLAAPPDAPPPPHPPLGATRKARRQLREQHEAAARQAAKRARDEQRAAARAPERIGHSDVRIVAPDPYTGAIHALLLHLEDEGFTGAPRSFGWDDQGRHLVEFVPGVRADHPKAPEDALDPARIGRFLRDMHEALASFEPPSDARWFEGLPAPGHELIVHQDIAPSNILIRQDGSLVAIDWDAAGPGTRLWDLAYAAHSFAPLYRAGADLPLASRRLRGLVDGYGLGEAEREDLVPLLAMRSQRMYDYLDVMRATGQSPWIELWQRGVGTVWKSDAQWIRDHADTWRRALLG